MHEEEGSAQVMLLHQGVYKAYTEHKPVPLLGETTLQPQSGPRSWDSGRRVLWQPSK